VALIWSTPRDVTGRWVSDDPIPATEDQIETLLDDAEDTILREFPDLPERVGDGPGMVPLRRVRKVAARVVIRHLRNPSGARSAQEGAGPFQRATTYGGDEPGGMYLTDQDRRELGGTKTGRAFQIDMTPMWNTAPLDRSIDPVLWYEV
jgi:hypothetical protein